MYEQLTIGLEADLDHVSHMLVPRFGARASSIVEALRYARLARVGGNDRRRFSFVHRRFAEFFVVDALRMSRTEVDVTSIPEDSRWRDCLVMYCGIADLPTRVKIARYCWSVIAKGKSAIERGAFQNAREAIHCMRFLTDAFRSDHEALKSFQTKLGAVVLSLLESRDLLAAKIGAEVIPLVDDHSQLHAVIKAFEIQSKWVCDTTLNSCRNMGRLDSTTNRSIRRYFSRFSEFEILTRFSDLNFSLSLSDAFRSQRRALCADLVEFIFMASVALSLSLFFLVKQPWVLILSIMIGCIFMAINFVSDYYSRRPIVGMLRWLVFSLPAIYIAGRGLVAGTPLVQRQLMQAGFTPLKLTTTQLVMAGVCLGILVAGWEVLLSIARRVRQEVRLLIYAYRQGEVKRAFSRLMKRLQDVAFFRIRTLLNALLWFFLFIFILNSAVWGIPKVWASLPSSLRIRVQELLTQTGRAAIYIVAFGATIASLFFIVRATFRATRKHLTRIREQRRIVRMGVPTAISALELYENLLSLQSARVRRQYIELLRLRRVRLVGTVGHTPEELNKDREVLEELSRLKEQWFGLAL
jgi:hypothetical protein